MVTSGWYLHTGPRTEHHCAAPQPPSAQAGRAQGQVIALLQPGCHQMATGPLPNHPTLPPVKDKHCTLWTDGALLFIEL